MPDSTDRVTEGTPTAGRGAGQRRPGRARWGWRHCGWRHCGWRRGGWRTAAAWFAVLAAVIALAAGYILQARTQPANSDGAGIALQGWGMLHGNLLLRGWWTTDVSFYTFEVPIDALVIAVRGLSADVVHVTAGIVYALLVLAAALLARGTARGGEGAARALLAAGTMIAPGLGEGTRVLLGSPDHVGVGVPILLALLLIDRAPRRWPACVAACVLLAWAQLDDPLAEFAAALPVALACLGRSGVALRRRGSWRYDAGLVIAALVSYELARIGVHLIRAAGGYSMRSLAAVATLVPPAQWGTQLLRTGQNTLLLFGADFFWQPGRLLTAIAVVHLAGAALALGGLLAGIAAVARGPGADRVTQILTLGTLATLGAAVFASQAEPGYGAHEIAVVLPFGAVLAGRAAGPWLARSSRLARWGRLARHGRLTAISAAGAVAACYLAALGYSAAQPPAGAPTQSLAAFLAAHDLTSGIGRYWAANITTAASDWHVRVIPAEPGPSQPYSWLTRPSWYDPDRYSANFVLAGTDPSSTMTYQVAVVLAAFGPPAREYRFDGYVIMVYDRNLLRDVQVPAQPSPDLGQWL